MVNFPIQKEFDSVGEGFLNELSGELAFKKSH